MDIKIPNFEFWQIILKYYCDKRIMIQCRVQFVCKTNISVRHTLQRVWACTLTRILKGSVYSKRDLRYARPTFSALYSQADLYATQIQTCCAPQATSSCMPFLSNVHTNGIFYVYYTDIHQDYYDLLAHGLIRCFISRYDGELFQFRSIMNWIRRTVICYPSID